MGGCTVSSCCIWCICCSSVILPCTVFTYHSFSVSSLHILTKDLSEYLHAQEKLSPSNLYRKQYGNLNHVFNTEDFSQIFHIEKDVIKLRPLKDLSSAVSASHLQPNEYSKCQGMWRGKFAHDIKTLRTTQSNQCARCGDIYRESVASMPLCQYPYIMHIYAM